MSRIIRLQSENVKRLTAIDIVPTSALTVVGGDNGEGKTSVLDSIAMGLGGKDAVPPMPVHRGKDSAQTIITLDNGIVVKRTFTAAGNTYLKVTSADGAVYPSPQAMLDGLTGKLSFDPLAFLRLDAPEQAKTLRRLVNLDFTKQDVERKRLYDERTAVNKRLAEMRGAVAALPTHADAPAKEISSADVLAEIEKAQAHNSGRLPLTAAANAANLAISQTNAQVKATSTSIAALEKQLADARTLLDKQTKARDKAQVAMTAAQDAETAFEEIDTTDLKAQLAACEETNRKVRANAQRATAVTEGIAKKAQADALTVKIDAIDKAKSEALSAVKFPVKGLSFADDAVTFDGFPLSQCSAALQQRVSVSIGAALNPKLRVMLIRDASLLDVKNLEALRTTAEELDLQIWAERVSKGAECSIIIEDGGVQGADPVESIAEEPPAVVAPVVVKPKGRKPVAATVTAPSTTQEEYV